MTSERQALLEWAEEGRLRPPALRAAAELAGVIPAAAQWRRFADRLLLWGGAVLVAAGLIFFLAYNWQDLGRYAKFALAEGCIAAALLLVWKLGLDRAGGKAALLTAALFTGALLALIGQTYQTGADTYELFATWALAILPWVLAGRFAAFWLVWIAIVNVAAICYYQAFGGLFGLLFAPDRLLWVLFALDTAALVAWEVLAARGVEWLRERWAIRILCSVSGASATFLAAFQLIVPGEASVLGVPAWAAWLAIAHAVYRRRIRDLFVLAGGVLSVVIVTACFLGKLLLHESDAGGFLLIGLVVLGLSAAGGWWLRTVAAEETA